MIDFNKAIWFGSNDHKIKFPEWDTYDEETKDKWFDNVIKSPAYAEHNTQTATRLAVDYCLFVLDRRIKAGSRGNA